VFQSFYKTNLFFYNIICWNLTDIFKLGDSLKMMIRQVFLVVLVFLIMINSFSFINYESLMNQQQEKDNNNEMFDHSTPAKDPLLDQEIGNSWKAKNNFGTPPSIRGTSKKHNVIRINNDTDFLAQASLEGWKGIGSAKSPMVIENLDIDANRTFAAIYIGNVTQIHFIIRNCSLYNSNGSVSLTSNVST